MATDRLSGCTSCGRVVRSVELSEAGWRIAEAGGVLCGLCFYQQFSPLLRLCPASVPTDAEPVAALSTAV